MEAHAKEKRAKTFERASLNAERAAEVCRLGRLRMTEVQKARREKLEAAEGTIPSLPSQKAKVVRVRKRTEISFNQRKDAVLEIHRSLAHKTDEEIIEELQRLLGIEENEAGALVQAAKQPRSIFES
jgi:hypothetical protein